MSAGSIHAPLVLPLRFPSKVNQNKNDIDTKTPIELHSTSPSVLIYYTVNGNRPDPYQKQTNKSTTHLYKSPFTLGCGKCTIRAIAIAEDKHAESGVVTKVFHVKEATDIQETRSVSTESTESLASIPKQETNDVGTVSSNNSETILENYHAENDISPQRQPSRGLSRPSTGQSVTFQQQDNPFNEEKLDHIQTDTSLPSRSNELHGRIENSEYNIVTAQDAIKFLQETNFLQCIFCLAKRPIDPYAKHCPHCGACLPILALNSDQFCHSPSGTYSRCLECKCSVPLDTVKCLVCEAPLVPRLLPYSSKIFVDKLICITCNTVNPSDYSRCVTCEAKLFNSADEPTPLLSTQISCEVCSASNNETNTYCIACGHKMKKINQLVSSNMTTDSTMRIEYFKESISVSTQTHGLYYPSSKALNSIPKIDQITPPKQTQNGTVKNIKPFSPGKGYWRQQVDHVCNHLKSYSQATPNFQQAIGQPSLGRINAITVHTENHQAIVSLIFNLKPSMDYLTDAKRLKPRLIPDADEVESIQSETSSLGKQKKKYKKSKQKRFEKFELSVDDYLLFKELLSAARPHVIEQLLEGEANPNVVQQKTGYTPLMTAIKQHASLEIIQLLLKYGAEINKQDEKGNTSLHASVSLEEAGLEVTKLLLENGGDLFVKNSVGNSPQALASNCESLMELFTAHIGNDTTQPELNSQTNIATLIS